MVALEDHLSSSAKDAKKGSLSIALERECGAEHFEEEADQIGIGSLW